MVLKYAEIAGKFSCTPVRFIDLFILNYYTYIIFKLILNYFKHHIHFFSEIIHPIQPYMFHLKTLYAFYFM